MMKIKTNARFGFFLLAMLAALALAAPNAAFAAPDKGAAGGGATKDEIVKPALPLEGKGFGALPIPEGKTGVDIAKSLVAKIVENLRFVIGAVAVVMIFLSAIRLITARGDEEVYKKQKNNFIMAVVGLALIGISGELASVFKTEGGGFIKDANVAIQQSRIFNRVMQTVLVFIKYLIGSISVLFIVRAGLRMVVMGGNEEELAKDKKALYYGIIGFVFVILASPLVNRVFFKIDFERFPGTQALRPALNAAAGVSEIIGITNVIVAFAVPLATLALIAGALMYALARGEDDKLEKAKKIMTWALIGLVVIYGAFAVVSTFVAGRFEGI